MTTTLWIVGITAVVELGVWIGHALGYVAGHEGGVLITKDGILFDGMERIIEAVNNDYSQCVSVCSKRRTPSEDINIKLRKIACKFTDKEMEKQAVFDKAMEATTQANIEAAESAKDCEGDDCRIVGKTFFGGDGDE